ncbi:Response regulator receiver domain-containing protein [Maribacter arcticus]|uniref:Response regulator receiver domain-containing protein n=2 Tax=Maribacter arcticus TaxID=561365 RepID=A0A1T4ZXR5_9FLAO|nr:Response regulator receiver domain-containing protein [Maribacter arcticus]|tara:strand:- start:1467 stop:1943 length:477 start_codon:yes stop_codon:yes gene_type:complete
MYYLGIIKRYSYCINTARPLTISSMSNTPLVWIIDDDDISKYVMKRNLRQLSVTNVIEFPDSVQPLKILSDNFESTNELPDIILLDLNMPILNGFQFMEEFKVANEKIKKDIQIYMLTSSLSSEDVDRAKSFPEISEYFIKPITLRNLSRIVDIVLQE